jgi:hypothetical protein
MYNLHNVVEAYLDVFPQSFDSITSLYNLINVNQQGWVLFYLFVVYVTIYVESKLVTN